MTDRLLDMIARRHPLTPKDAGEFAALKVNGMKFTIQAYDAAGLGHVSLMQAGGMLGLMKMDTLIINPTERDLPLFSYDRIFAMGNDTLILELYDTVAGSFDHATLDRLHDGAQALPERDPGVHWYDGIRLPQSLSKKGKKAQTAAFDQVTGDYLAAWLAAEYAAPFDANVKRRKAQAYVNGLLHNGGPSTDVFKKALGDEKTAALFRQVLFGTE